MAFRRSSWIGTTAGSSSRSCRQGSRPCATRIVAALIEVLAPEGILLRNDAPARRREGLSAEISRGVRRGPPRRSRCRRAASATWRHRGTARRPAPFSISVPTAFSPGPAHAGRRPRPRLFRLSRIVRPSSGPQSGECHRHRCQPGSAGAWRRQRDAQRALQHRVARS